MEEFWKAFDSVEKIKRSDFEEAIKDFDNRCYKSCAMMLYSLIDGRLIRLQGGPKTEKENLESAKKTKRLKESLLDIVGLLLSIESITSIMKFMKMILKFGFSAI